MIDNPATETPHEKKLFSSAQEQTGANNRGQVGFIGGELRL